MDAETFGILMGRLANTSGQFKILFELDQGFVRVRAVPGNVHGAAVNAYNLDFMTWSVNNNPTNLRPLKCTGDASKRPRFIQLMC
jgi:hypothetical protein